MALYSDGMGLAWLKVQTEKRNEVICFMGFCVKTLLDGRNPRVILCKLDAATISFFVGQIPCGRCVMRQELAKKLFEGLQTVEPESYFANLPKQISRIWWPNLQMFWRWWTSAKKGVDDFE